MNRSILNRRMFAEGDEVTPPVLNNEIFIELQEIGIDPTNKSYEQINAEIDDFIAKEKRRVIFDPTDPIDYLSAGLTLTGIGAGLGGGIKAARAGMKGKQAYEKINKLQKIKNMLNPVKKNPGGVQMSGTGEVIIGAPSYGLKVPQSSLYAGQGVDVLNTDEDLSSEAESIKAELTALQETETKPKEITPAEKGKKTKKVDKNAIDQEVKNIEEVIQIIKGADKQKSEKYQKEKARTRARNRNIFMEEMAAALAATDNLADGLSMGAANAAKAVGDAQEAENLAYAEFLKEQEEKNKPKELKTSDINDIARDYATKSGEIEGSNILISEVSQLRNLLQRNDVTGLSGWMQRLVGKGQGFVGADLELKNAQQVSNIAKFLEARMVQALLDEKGKTISDADRKLIKDLLGDIESATSNRATILDKLQLIETTLRKSKTDSERYLKFYDAEYGDLIPNLSVFRKGTPESSVEEETEVQVTQEDVEDVID